MDARAAEFRGSAGFFRIFDWPPGDAPDCTAGAAVVPFRKMMEAIPAADRERVDQAIKNTLQTDEPFDLDHRIVRRDGTIRVVRSRGQIVAGQDGSARLVGTTHDITDYRLAHEKLLQSEERFRSLVANIPAVIWSSDVHGQIQYISPNAEPVFGFTSEEICEKGAEIWFERICPNDSSRVVQAFHQLFSEGRPFDVEYRVQHKDGTWIWVHDRAYRTYERDGVRCADGVISDITERKRAEKELRLTQFSLERASNNITWSNSQGHFVYANEAACRSLGYSREEFLSLSVPDLNPHFRKEEDWRRFWEELKKLGSMTFESQNITKQGRVFPVEITVNYLEFDGQEYTFAFVRDISERKRAEEELYRSRQMLQSILDSIPQRVFWKDRNCIYLGCNRAFATDAGVNKPAEIVGKNDFELCLERGGRTLSRR